MRKFNTLANVVLTPLGGCGRRSATIEYTFSRTNRTFSGPPLLVGGTWNPLDAAVLASTGVLAQYTIDHARPLDEQLGVCVQGSLERMVMTVNSERDVDALILLMATRHAPTYVRVGVERKMAVELVNLYPELTVFAGSFISHVDANSSMADVVALGSPADNADLDKHFGVGIDPVLMCAMTRPPKVAAFGCRTTGDVAKCFALGAEFVEIGPGMSSFTIEHIIQQLAAAVYVVGGDSPYDLVAAASLRGN
jgi:hypothetical protein